jgi:hypothetical protein
MYAKMPFGLMNTGVIF